MNSNDLFTAGFKSEPYWWKDAPRPHIAETTLPGEIDVLVIGAGYTGLMAARETAKGGRSTLVLDAESAGFGCSSRNGGQVSTSITARSRRSSGPTRRRSRPRSTSSAARSGSTAIPASSTAPSRPRAIRC